MEQSRANGNKKPQITLYTTEPCRRCHRAKAILEARDLAYREVNLAKDPVGRRELAKRTGRVTFPQVVIDGRPLGGFKELEEAARSGHLAALAAA
jgi:glutaredoxin 3